jgi:hypothetical protein
MAKRAAVLLFVSEEEYLGPPHFLLSARRNNPGLFERSAGSSWAALLHWLMPLGYCCVG